MKRRKFVSNTALAASSLFFLRCKAEETKKVIEESTGQKVGDFGLQLWSVRHQMAEDPKATLKTLADIGYNDIETDSDYMEGAKFYGMDPKDFNAYLSDIGIKHRSTHVKTGSMHPDWTWTMTNGWEDFCNLAAELGIESVILGYTDPPERETLDNYKYLNELLNKCGETAKQYGLAMAYHNHDFEFFKIDDQIPYDLMLNETDPALVNFELDNYWIAKAGYSSLDYFDKYPGRFHYWHVKDMDDTEDKFFTEVGTGIIDYVSIFKKAKESGMKNFYVEQDDFRKYEALESVKMSHDFVRGMEF